MHCVDKGSYFQSLPSSVIDLEVFFVFELRYFLELTDSDQVS